MSQSDSQAQAEKNGYGLEAKDKARTRGLGPAFTLALLAPTVAEVLSGATRVSFLFALIPEIMVWGCGALIIREVVRRRRLPWTSMLLMGLGLSIAEEFVIQQTSLAPLPWISGPIYGRALGVNWLYFLFMLGYESVWVVLVPVHLTEMIFWRRRNQPWLRIRGLVISSVIFLLGSFVAWYAWVKRARPMVFHVPPYHPPRLIVLLGVLAIVGFVAVALSLRDSSSRSERKAPSSWVAALVVLAFGFPWYALLGFIFDPNLKLRALPFWIPMLGGIAWAAAAFLVFRHWSSSAAWNDKQIYALIFAAILVCMIAGFLGSSLWPRVDVIGKSILDIVAVVLLLVLGRVHFSRLTAAPAVGSGRY
jgi:hypothetical protein